GGRPLLCVFDRPKTIALKWRKNGEVTEWNSVFAYATLEMGVGVELCWPYRAQQKGSVENLVGFVKSSFFKVRRFHDEEDLRQQLQEWHREVNEERPCRATGIIPAVRLAEEAPRLRALKVQPGQLALRIPVYVGPTATGQGRPRLCFEEVYGLHQILGSRGPEVLRRAMEEGLKEQIFGAFYVERSLQAGLSFSPVVQ